MPFLRASPLALMALSKPAPAAKPQKAASVKKFQDVLASGTARELFVGPLEVAFPATTCRVSRRVVRFEVEIDGVPHVFGELDDDDAHEEEEGALATKGVVPEYDKQVPDQHVRKPEDQLLWLWRFVCCNRSDDYEERALPSMPAGEVEKTQ